MTSPSTTSPNSTQGMYVDYNIPLGLYDLTQQVIANTQNDPNTPQIPTPSQQQQWFSQPRSGTDTTTEVLQVNFKVPLSVSELQWDALRCSCHFEAWYQDQQGNWRQVLDDNRIPVTMNLSTATAASWYTANFFCYPIIATAIQWRITRIFDPTVGTLPYCVGMRNGLIRRNIYTQSDGTQSIEPQQDLLGNVITAFVQNWDASQAIDNNTSTFWRSAALPDPQAVCSLYLDCRDPGGNPQLIDSLYIDPVYGTGTQQLNLYYSNDDTTPAYTTLSPISAVPTTDVNTNWQLGTGMWDISPPDDSQPSLYQFPMQWGPIVSQDAWVGIEWTPNFSPVPSNTIQLITITGTPTGGSFTLTYTTEGTTQTTIGLAYNSTSAQIQEALEALTDIGTGNVLVGGADGGPYQVSFQGSLGSEAIATLTAIASLTGGEAPAVTVVTQTSGGVGEAPPQNCTLFSVIPSGVEGTNAIQTLAMSGDATGGTFTLSYNGQTTAAIPYNADFTVIEPALEALSSIGDNNVVVSGDAGGPWTVTFVGALAARPIVTMSVTFATQAIVVHGSPTGGTFTLSFEGQTTAPLAFNAIPSVVQTALAALSSIGTGNVTVAGTLGSYVVTFIGALGDAAQALITATASLTGGSTPGVTITAASSLTGGTTGGTIPAVQISTTQPGVVPIAATTGQFVPTIYYDVGGGQIVLEISDGTTVHTYNCSISPIFAANQTIRIAVGWTYDSPAGVYMQVNDVSGNVLGNLVNTTPPPANLSFDGTISFTEFQGTFTAHVVKLENWNGNLATFMANAQVYVNPDPVQPNASGTIPATTLNNAIYAAAWTVQQLGTGGSDASVYSAKLWTPIFSNYVVQKGMLYFPSQISLKYLQLEFTNLTQESYPVYDSGIQVSYSVFPVSVTSTANTTSNAPALVQQLGDLLTMGADVLLSGVGSVNWLNPASINQAINSVFGTTTSTSTILTTGSGSSITLPNTTSLDLAGQMSSEVSTPWLFKRSPLSATTLAGSAVNTVASSVPTQGLTTVANTSQSTVANTFTPAVNTASNPPTLPQQGADFWVFPGGNMRLPASVMQGLTGSSSTVTTQSSWASSTVQRFSTVSVHQYAQNTVTRDAAVAYFAGIAEVQPYTLTYIDGQSPAQYTFSLYDSSQWVFTNIQSFATGVISTAGTIPSILNPEFDTDINNWIQAQGTWSWDGTTGHWDLGSALATATGAEQELLSSVVTVAPGATLEASVWVSWADLVATAGTEAIQMQVQFLNNGTFVSEQAAGLTYNPWPASTPADDDSNTWAQIVFSAGTSNQITVPDGVNQMQLALVVTTAVTAGSVWFDTVLIGNTGAIEGTAFKDFVTTSTFDKLTCAFTDSGSVRSDSMWAQTDPNDSNISNTALAYYTSTIPDVVPAGMWGDTVATWADPDIFWGEPAAVVSIQVDPNRIFDNKRVLDFTRAAGAGEAGIVVRQVTNFVPNGLFRLGCVFYKPTANDNQISISLIRVSDGVVIYEETFNPVVGYWYNYVTAFTEIPDTDDQEYTIQLVCTGDSADQLYLNDLYTEIAGIRYFIRLGDESQFLFDVTPLAYAGLAVVSSTTPVTEFSCQTTILGPHFYAYGAVFTPNYLSP
jgi:hypothetical protein